MSIVYPRTWVAACFCLLLSCLQTLVSVLLIPGDTRLVDRWQQLAANILVLLAANLVGLFIHNLTEEGQRRAFLDTRDCIAARLEMEDENEKLVSTTLYLLLYSSVADPYSFNPNPAKNMIPDPEDP